MTELCNYYYNHYFPHHDEELDYVVDDEQDIEHDDDQIVDHLKRICDGHPALLVLVRRLLHADCKHYGAKVREYILRRIELTQYFNISDTKPNDANVFGNPPYPGYTACGSVTNWIDEMVVSYNESKIYAYNFAYGGATIDANIVAPYTSTVLSMTDQMNEFVNNVASKPSYAPWTSANSLFSFFIGINDVSGTWWKSSDPTAYVPDLYLAALHTLTNISFTLSYTDTLLTAYFALVQKAYDAGARNFLFINVPCVERSPYALSLGSTTAVTIPLRTAINDYNTKLAAKITSWKSGLSGVKTWYYDSNTMLGKILDNPTSYGFQDNSTYGSATNLAWCNDFHVSPGVHHYFASEMHTLLSGTGF
ncbi:hypothetical protein FRB90_011910 [Tulasnella sp. 427]|nr:hypothetical protein FRB90_011910 [Tulasnella sp. 427]